MCGGTDMFFKLSSMFHSRFPLYQRVNPGTLPNDPPVQDPPVTDPPPRRNGTERRSHVHPPSVECGYCGSTVATMTGEVLKFSKTAKELRDSRELFEKLEAKIAELKSENESLRAKLSQPTTEPVTKKSGW
jgi:hypothetical protein